MSRDELRGAAREVAAEAEEGLFERVAGVLGVALGPEVEEEPVARDAALAAGGEDGEEGEGHQDRDPGEEMDAAGALLPLGRELLRQLAQGHPDEGRRPLIAVPAMWSDQIRGLRFSGSVVANAVLEAIVRTELHLAHAQRGGRLEMGWLVHTGLLQQRGFPLE